MLESLKISVCQANLTLPEYGLVVFTWGNVSGIDCNRELMVIKPSGVDYRDLRPEDMAVIEIKTGKQLEGKLRPSSDSETHLEIYRNFGNVGGVVHTHSRWATTFAQSGLAIPPLGTTHADYFHGEIPCSRQMTAQEIKGQYELETGKLIVETFSGRDPDAVPAVLVRNHGPFAWGKDALNAVHNSVVLEEVAKMAWQNILLDRDCPPISRELLDKHYFRKHGKNAYYGQTVEE